jgi:hypothetical protein
MAIRYPAEFTAGQATDYLQIKKYRKNYSGSTTNAWTKEGDDIILNIPQKVVETIGQNWRNSTLGPEVKNIFTGIRDTSSLQNAAGLAGEAAKRLVENALLENAVSAFGKLGASNISENSILSGTSGVIYNPNMEVLYEGPQFRQFNFQFILFAKSGDDAKNIHRIVRFFQQASVPSTNGSVDVNKTTAIIGAAGVINSVSTAGTAISQAVTGNIGQAITSLSGGIASAIGNAAGGLATAGGLIFNSTGSNDSRFIKQPPFIALKFMRGSEQHPYILPTKPCAINNLSVDYTPSGNYTILNNFGEQEVATVVVTTITMSLTEVLTVFEQDYNNNGSQFFNTF